MPDYSNPPDMNTWTSVRPNGRPGLNKASTTEYLFQRAIWIGQNRAAAGSFFSGEDSGMLVKGVARSLFRLGTSQRGAFVESNGSQFLLPPVATSHRKIRSFIYFEEMPTALRYTVQVAGSPDSEAVKLDPEEAGWHEFDPITVPVGVDTPDILFNARPRFGNTAVCNLSGYCFLAETNSITQNGQSIPNTPVKVRKSRWSAGSPDDAWFIRHISQMGSYVIDGYSRHLAQHSFAPHQSTASSDGWAFAEYLVDVAKNGPPEIMVWAKVASGTGTIRLLLGESPSSTLVERDTVSVDSTTGEWHRLETIDSVDWANGQVNRVRIEWRGDAGTYPIVTVEDISLENRRPYSVGEHWVHTFTNAPDIDQDRAEIIPVRMLSHDNGKLGRPGSIVSNYREGQYQTNWFDRHTLFSNTFLQTKIHGPLVVADHIGKQTSGAYEGLNATSAGFGVALYRKMLRARYLTGSVQFQCTIGHRGTEKALAAAIGLYRDGVAVEGAPFRFRDATGDAQRGTRIVTLSDPSPSRNTLVEYEIRIGYEAKSGFVTPVYTPTDSMDGAIELQGVVMREVPEAMLPLSSQYFYKLNENLGIPIPADPTPVLATIIVPASCSFDIRHARIRMLVEGIADADLAITFTAPNTTIISIYDKADGVWRSPGVDEVIEGDDPNLGADSGDIHGINSVGTWTISIVNNGSDTGTLQEFGLEFR